MQGRNKKNMLGAVWLIGIGILWAFDLWWPGILILIGITLIIQAVSKSNSKTEVITARPPKPIESPETKTEEIYNDPPEDLPDILQLEPVEKPAAVELPAACPMCGGPVKENNVVWKDSHTPMCSFCESPLIKV